MEMRKLKTILVVAVVAASLYAAGGTAWARSEVPQRGTSWTEAGDTDLPDLGISWELLTFAFYASANSPRSKRYSCEWITPTGTASHEADSSAYFSVLPVRI